MMDYGSAPDIDELELTVFGPGYGEAIAVHLGEGKWLLIDSCFDPSSNIPATSVYLDQLNVKPEDVKAIVASHWHDDHVRGISQLAQKYPDAEFFLSAALNNKEAATFFAAYSGVDASGLARGTSELFSVVDQRNAIYPALHRVNVLELTANSQNIRVTALSPTSNAFVQSIANFAQYLPCIPQPITHAPELKPNLEAVVIHVDFGEGNAILLGSDLQSDQKLGWPELLADKWCLGRQRASVYKVSHHGSHTGDHPGIWETLLRPGTIACMTPFNRSRLPNEEDKIRIKSNASSAYISSGASRRPKIPNNQIKRLGDVCKDLSPVNSGFGAIQLRKKISDQDWQVKLFGDAKAL